MKVVFSHGGEIMSVLTPKIRKLQKALELKGKIYLVTKTQVFSNKLGRLCTLNKLDHLMPWEEFKKKFPDKAERKKKKGVPVRVEIIRTFKEIDVLMYLVEVLKAGDKDG